MGGQSAPGSGIQVADQKIERGNKALVRAQYDGTPIRVIRGSGGDPKFSPTSGYRYDGLYEVRDHWFKPSQDGPLIIQFELVAIDYGIQSIAKSPEGASAPPSGNANPDRRFKSSSSLVRNQANVDWIKDLYANICQVCRVQLMTDAGSISIGAHIQGLGKPHNGPDVVGNMLCLCHNCHAIFDSGSFYINNDRKTITWLHKPNTDGVLTYSTELYSKSEHQIGLSYVQAHRRQVAGIIEEDEMEIEEVLENPTMEIAEALGNPAEFLNKVFEVTQDDEGVKSYEIKDPTDLMGILLGGLLIGAMDDLETDEPQSDE
jgi:putative restriction endonuclease